MKHAFLVIAHNEEPLLLSLLKQLDYERFDVYLDIDAKAKALRESIQAQQLRFSNLTIVENPVSVYWGDRSQVASELLLFKTACQHGPYAYYHLLSGVDLLLKSPSEVYRFFEAHHGKEFINFWDKDDARRELNRRVQRYYFFTKNLKDKGTFVHAITAPIRNISLAIQKVTSFKRCGRGIYFRKGSNWVSITEECCKYIVENADELYKRLNHTLCADEIFVQTIVWNSPFKDNIFEADVESTETSVVRKIDWTRGHPYVWQKADIQELLHSSALFARKFSSKNMSLVNEILKYTLEEEK